jgi:phosphoribosylformylglycinamidine cyclo-ligase
VNKASKSDSYRLSGVDITAGYKAVELMKSHVARTLVPGVRSDLGGFGGLFELDLADMPHPLLVSGTDGVGTKLKLAFLMDRHDTVGIDCVAMCVNDIVCCGAKPLFFLDYIATGKTVPERIEAIVKGIGEGCVQAGCALVGGETAEMPGFYEETEYDLAGFSVGAVDRDRLFDKQSVEAGDLLVALPSTGIHSNGFSLVRKVFGFEQDPSVLDRYVPSLGRTLGEALLEPTAIYVKPVLSLAESVQVKSVAHITGGGFFENIPRCLPEGKQAVIRESDVRVLPVFDLLQKTGDIPRRDMFNTFNMGVGMCLVLDRQAASAALSAIPGSYILGTVEDGNEGVVLC